MSARSFAVVLASSFAAMALSGCSVDPARNPTPRCDNDSQCVGGGTCYRGYCLTQEEEAGPPDSGIDAPGADAHRDDANVDAPGDANLPFDGGTDAFVPSMCTMPEDCDDGDTCSGVEDCVVNVCVNDPRADGTDCDLDEDITTRDICVASACAQSRCGDRYVDVVAMEQCDDGNDTIGDGCDDCRYTCEGPVDCADGNECNGAEACSAAHACQRGVDLPNGDPCAGGSGHCMDGACRPNSCTMNEDCDDGDVCNGAEVCGTGNVCVAGPPPDCGDGNNCTADSCAGGVCANRFVDADGDGHAPDSIPFPCADDCDDGDARNYPGAAEICGDMEDNDCDGVIDEALTTTWYVDCDGDGYAASGADVLVNCVRPAPAAALCASGGGWTARAPTTEPDCNDTNASVNPGQTMFQTTAISGAAAAVDYDYDCNGTEERRTTAVGSCSGTLGVCSLAQGWQGAVAACGATANWIVSCSGLGCATGVDSRVQGCL